MLLKTKWKAAKVHARLDTYDYEAEALPKNEYNDFTDIRSSDPRNP